jgi:hypothetical protein
VEKHNEVVPGRSLDDLWVSATLDARTAFGGKESLGCLEHHMGIGMHQIS